MTDHAVAAIFAAEGLVPHAWSGEARFRFTDHRHARPKLLVCVEGSITFHTPDRAVELLPGDRLELPAGTRHSATVGPGGVTCLEAFR